MLNLKQIRENPEFVQTKLRLRSHEYDIQSVLTLDQQQRELETQRSKLQARSNEIGKWVGQILKAGGDPQGTEVQALKEEGNDVKQQLSDLEPQEREIKTRIEELLLALPNLPDDSTPIGANEDENVEVRRWGDDYVPTHPDILPHWEIGEKLGIMNFERSVRIAQSRFVTLMGAGAALERALIQFMLDRHIEANYTEILPPILINTQSLTASGQLPKFAEESFRCKDDDLWLTPTAEVPLTSLHRDEILAADELPIYYCAYTPCFRREAGSYGRDTRGLIRLHQFNKVEMYKFVHPEQSMAELESLTESAAGILQALKLPYRILELCTGDIGFSATKTYDLEVWLPSAGKYREISSCSNCKDFQARRGNIRFKEAGKKGTQFLHTLNGSGLAIGRTMSAILENYQQPDGTVKVPDVLRSYLGRDLL